MRRAARVDRNQPEIVKALRAEGWAVAHTHVVAGGFPDVVAAKAFPRRRVTILVEIKDGSLPPSARELTEEQVIFHANWPGQIEVVSSLDELYALLDTIEDEEYAA